MTDEDVRELVDAGFSEDEIFEHTVATAVAAGLDRLGGTSDSRMRLACVDAVEVPRPIGVLKTINYRPERFGRPYSAALDLAMRAFRLERRRTRARFAAFVSSLNQCPF